MAQIVTITNPLTGQPAQVDQLEHTAQQIDDYLNIARLASNPNLLDNWYFRNPVNQRGATNGTAGWNKYFLDRWQGYCIYDVTKGYLEVGSGSYLVQKIENGSSIPYPVTFSILFQDGTFGYQTAYADGGFELIGENIKGFADSQIHGENPYISYNNNSGSTVGIIAVKFELGTVQTLAHQDADGNWVLNEIPDYGEQLGRCQYYSRFFGGDIEIPCGNNSAGTYIEGTLPLTMRSGSGSISYSEGFLFTGNGTFYTVTSANVSSNGGRVKIGVNVSGQLSGNLQATLFLKNCSILFDL